MLARRVRSGLAVVSRLGKVMQWCALTYYLHLTNRCVSDASRI